MVILAEQYRRVVGKDERLHGHRAVRSSMSPVARRTSLVEQSGTPGQQINEYFVGSTFDSSGNQIADGTQYNWTILYQGENQDALPGVYITPQGALNPREQSLLAPDLSVIQAGIGASAYSPTAGETGFKGWYDRNAGSIAFGAGVGSGAAAGLLTGGLADIGIAAMFGTDLGFWGGLASAAASNAAAGFSAGTVQGLASGEDIGQSLEQGGIGAAFGGGFGVAGFLTPYAGRALASGVVSLYGGLTDAATAAGQYAGTFLNGFNNADIQFTLGSGSGGEFLQRLDAGINAIGANSDELQSGFQNVISEQFPNGENQLALGKGFPGIGFTTDGVPDFAGTPYLYPGEPGAIDHRDPPPTSVSSL